MQTVKLNLSNYKFYCPASGKLVINQHQMEPSPAMVFCYLEGGSQMSFAMPWLINAFDECKDIAKNGGALNIPPVAFDYLTEDYLAERRDYVLLSITSNTGVLHLCFDMYYAMKAEEEDDEIGPLPDIDKLQEVFAKGCDTKPTLNGYAVFTSDELGVGAFMFCNDLNSLHELLASVVFMEGLTDGYDVYTKETLKKLHVTNLIYNPSTLEEEDLQYFVEELNPLLECYQIDFLGKVKDLFNTENEFAAGLIETFGSDPNKKYLKFLQEYYKG